jgi:D-xylose transport system substrate-binding protein
MSICKQAVMGGFLGLLAVALGCSSRGGDQKPKIGLLMDTLKEERWQKDRDYFVERAAELGAEVLVQSANSDDIRQNAQAENMITQGVDVLVVVPHNGVVAATIVEAAHAAGIRVLAYDRIINDCDLDIYISFDNERVGELQADYLVKQVPRGNYILLGGAPTDFNAILLRKGQMKVLQPFLDRGDIDIVADQWCKDWQPIEALKHTENALTQTNNDIDAVVASNDGTAGGAIQALAEQKLAGKVPVSGQDADLAACQRIVEGLQAMTVYKPIRPLAYRAAEVAMHLLRDEPVPESERTINNGKFDVPSILLEPIQVDKSNIVRTVIDDGFHRLDQVFENVPREQWPASSDAAE